MDEQPIIEQHKKDSFKVLVVIVLVVLAGAVGWLVYRTEDIAKQENNAAATDTKDDAGDTTDTVGYTDVKSGSGGFQLRVPDGWGPLTNVMDSDFVILPGMEQPVVAAGAEVKVQEVQSYGTDSSSVFTAMLVKKGEAAEPRGEASEFTIGKGEDALVGKKYSYVFAKDELEGIGYTRFQGDRTYEYVFPFDDKEFRVYYSVYGSDPRNLSVTVDEIVQTATVNKNQIPATR